MLTTIGAISICPACKGTGQDYSVKHHRLVMCDLCEGRRWVPLESCRGCGRPAFRFWPPRQQPILRYCGREDCFNKLVVVHKPKITLVEAVKAVQDAAAKRVNELKEFKDQMKRRLGPCC